MVWGVKAKFCFAFGGRAHEFLNFSDGVVGHFQDIPIRCEG